MHRDDHASKALERARRGVLVFFASELRALVVTGDDRKSWLNGLLTCDLAPLAPGDAAYGLKVTQKGRIESDVWVVLDTERIWLTVQVSVAESLFASFEHHLIMEDAAIAPSDYDVVLAHGPRAAEFAVLVRDVGAVAAPLDMTGLGGAVIFVPKGVASSSAINERLARVDGAVGDDETWNILRLECGIPRFGVDFDSSNYPQEASLEKRAVSFSKGCYLGQEVVYMLEKRGHVKKKLVPFTLQTDRAPAHGAVVHSAAAGEIGEVSSAVWSPREKKTVGLAMIKYVHSQQALSVQIDGASGSTIVAPA